MRRSAGRGPRAAGSAARARTRAAARHPSWSSHRGALPGTEATVPGNAAGPEPGSDGRRGSRPGREPGERRHPDRSCTWSWKIRSPQLPCHASACPKCGNVKPAQHACVSTRETDCADGDARERPGFPARSAGLPQVVLGTGDGAVQLRPGSVPVVLPGRRQSLPLTGRRVA